MARRLQSVHFRHLHVHQNHVVGLPLQCGKRFQSVPDCIGAIAILAQQTGASISGLPPGLRPSEYAEGRRLREFPVVQGRVRDAGASRCCADRMFANTLYRGDCLTGLVSIAANPPASTSAWRGPTELRPTSGSSFRPAGAAYLLCQHDAVHVRHLNIQYGNIEFAHYAPHDAPTLPARLRTPLFSSPSFAPVAASICRFVWLSSTIKAWQPCKHKR